MYLKPTFKMSNVALLLLAVVIYSCSSNKKKLDQNELKSIYSESLAKEISYVTSGEIHFDDKIQVMFNNPIIQENEVDSSPKDVFNFSPNIKGKAVWVSRTVLQFLPDKPFPTRSNFEGTLNLQKLSSRFKEINLENLEFKFYVLGRDIASFNGIVELKRRDDPKVLVYRGTLSFTEKAELETVQKSSRVKSSSSVSLSWSKVDDRNFIFTSSDIVRADNNQEFTFQIDKKQLELESDYSENFIVTPLQKMVPLDFRTDEAGRSPRIRVNFSDELDIEQNIDGLFSVVPQVKFEVKKLGKSAILDGDFKFGAKYQVIVQKGVRSRWGTKTTDETTKDIKFSDIAPQLEFASDGIILPTSNQKKVQFYTTNLKRVHLEVKKVYTNKIGTFIQSAQLKSTKTRNTTFNDSYASAVGVIVKSQTIELGSKQNEWLLNEFDLSELFSKYDDGLFLMRINFTPEDVSLPVTGNVLDYIYEKGQVYKPLFLSNLGLTVKSSDSSIKVFVTDIVTGNPRSSVKVSLLDYDGDVRRTANTDNQGVASFGSNYFYYVIAEEGKQVTVLNQNEMKWSNSGFDVGGVRGERNDTRAYIYTERGVYRPGDSIHLSVMVKNADNTYPLNHPVSINVNDPQYNTIYSQTLVSGTDGFYTFKFNTEENAPTGNYNVNINTGGSWFNKNIKIETVVAEQLKVLVKPLKKEIIWTDKSVEFELNANYLFGAPAANLKAEVSAEVHPIQMTFPKYSEFFFSRADVDFKPFTQSVVKIDLNAEGKFTGNWIIPSLGNVPSALKVKIIGKVIEKGGQTNEGWNVVNMHVYPNYVGIKDPSGYGYFKTGEEAKFPIVLIDANGNKVSGKQVKYRIYRNDKWWWYQYNNRRNFQLKYKEDSQTYLEVEGNASLSEGVSFISFNPAENGEYLIEVIDGGNGHSASMFFSAYQYGSAPGGDLNEGTLALMSDKSVYNSSETAKIKLPNPKHGSILVTIEKGHEMLNWFWVDPSKSSENELIIDIPLKKSMLPNAYVTVSVIQPHNQTINDRPIRMFGILPLMIEDADTKINFNIETLDNLVPNQNFEVKISTQSKKRVQFTIAVVDEGLLSLTQFQTPRPWNEFYKKIGLFVNTYDVFSHVISANKGDVFQTFSIGGSDDMDYRESQLDPIDGKKRFKPVSMFKGPLFTDERGNATVKFQMPNYNGAVRVMVVGTDKGSYGNAEKTVPVRSDIIMQPSIPRVLNPGDEFIIPIALFKINPKVKVSQFTIATEGSLEIIGKSNATVDFSQKSEGDISFKVRVKEAVGQAKIIIKGVSGDIQVQSETDIKVIPTSLRIYDKATEKLEKGKTISMNVPAIGLNGTNNATLDINLFPNMDFDHRLKWLISYPYGCVEQTTSAVFPQLMLKRMGYFRDDEAKEIDRNINEGILRLQQFMVNGGGFAYWPGNTEASEWGTNYASHFLVEAKKLGYSIPDFLYNNAVNGLKNASRQNLGYLTTRVNRTFILSLAGQQPLAEMNLLMENELSNMSIAEKWMLAAAYHLAGAENVRDQILSNVGTSTKVYDPFSYDFSSKERDNAIVLYCATIIGEKEKAELAAKNISAALSSREYFSTQTSAYMLLALGKYFETIGVSAAKGQIVNGTVTLANGNKIEFNQNGRVTIPIKDNFNSNIQISLSSNSNVDQVYATLSWNGVPLKDQSVALQKNLSLKVSWLDESGNSINPQNLKQGATFFGKFSVKNTSQLSNVSELALVQVIPSGWQVENTRINSTLLPDWARSWNLNKEKYLDIRDDRIMWFFNLTRDETLDFVVKLNCVSAGEFWLPGTLLEAMYNNDYKATTEGKKVYVEAFN
jgi:uncharacterized protein YfaS (alpha-2-macroglobulin family)